jgi:hypothetical protein
MGVGVWAILGAVVEERLGRSMLGEHMRGH